jgi:hypothetical protein
MLEDGDFPGRSFKHPFPLLWAPLDSSEAGGKSPFIVLAGAGAFQGHSCGVAHPKPLLE